MDPTNRSANVVLGSYQMAERLSSRLQGMGTDLTTMIDEINIASSSLSKNNKTDDSVCLHIYIYLTLWRVKLIVRALAAITDCQGTKFPFKLAAMDRPKYFSITRKGHSSTSV